MDSERLSLTELQYQLSRDPDTYRNDHISKLEELLLFISQAFLKAFMRLKSKDLIPMIHAVDIAFKLYRCKDKEIRKTLRSFLIGEIKLAREAVLIMLSLFKKNVWNDARTANLIAESCFTKNKKNEVSKIKQLRLGFRVGNKTKGRKKHLDRSIKHVHKDKDRKAKKSNPIINFYALNLLHDPQTFAERLFRKLERCSDRFEIRLLILELISLLIGLNKLLLLNFYPFVQRFLRPHQKEVTHLLLFSAQASHDQLPPDVIEPVVRTIADNFITERASSEAIAVGLNSVREICTRCPYAINQDLLSDLIQYRSYRNKNVVAAARSIIRLYRKMNPEILPRKERGRLTESQVDVVTSNAPTEVALHYGQFKAVSSVPGAEIVVLNQDKKKAAKKDCKKTKKKQQHDDVDECGGEADEESEEEDEGSQDDDDEGEWMSCSSEGDSDSDEGMNDESKNEEDEEKKVDTRKCATIDAELLKSQTLELASSRLFTQEEFEAMRKHQQAKEKRFASYSSFGSKKRKRNDDSDASDASDDDDGEDNSAGHTTVHGLVSMSNIMRLVKRPKQTKAERIESIESGRLGRDKYGYKVNRTNAHASTTNREKAKNKTFQMVKHKVRGKTKRSYNEKQQVLRQHLRTLAKQSR